MKTLLTTLSLSSFLVAGTALAQTNPAPAASTTTPAAPAKVKKHHHAKKSTTSTTKTDAAPSNAAPAKK